MHRVGAALSRPWAGARVGLRERLVRHRRLRQYRALLRRDLPAVAEEDWTAVRQALLAVLSAEDPMGPEPGAAEGAPADEYLIEAIDLARMFVLDGVVTAAHLEICWAHQFGEALEAGVAERVAPTMTAEARRALARVRQHPTQS